MAVLTIREYGDPVLRKVSNKVTKITDKHRRLIQDMIETMYQEPGVGLAAPQVGVNERIIVIDSIPSATEKQPLALINPEIIEESSETVLMEEGCLSIPDFKGDVRRPRRIKVHALDENGSPILLEGDDIQSRIVQHEVDHLDGILFVERMSMVRRDIAKRKLKKRFMNGEFA